MTSRRRFRFIREIAEGGFGKVYLAEMQSGANFSSVVAIKVLHGKWAQNEEIAQRSRDEARLLGRLRHRNIVRVEDLTSIHGQCAVIMEYLEGVDLKTLINTISSRGERLPLRCCFEIIGAVSEALRAAYNHAPLQGGEALRLIHRDIKPSNIMLTVGGDVKLLMGIGACVGWMELIETTFWYAAVYIPVGLAVLIYRKRLGNLAAVGKHVAKKASGQRTEESDRPESTLLWTGPVISVAAVIAWVSNLAVLQ